MVTRSEADECACDGLTAVVSVRQTLPADRYTLRAQTRPSDDRSVGGVPDMFEFLRSTTSHVHALTHTLTCYSHGLWDVIHTTVGRRRGTRLALEIM